MSTRPVHGTPWGVPAAVALALVLGTLGGFAPSAAADHVDALYMDHWCVQSEGRHVHAECSVEHVVYQNVTTPEPVPEESVHVTADAQGVVVDATDAAEPAHADLAGVTVAGVAPWELLLDFHYETAPWTDPTLTEVEREEARQKTLVLDLAESTGVHVRLVCGWDVTQTARVCQFYNPEADAETAVLRAHRDAVVEEGAHAATASAGGLARDTAPAADVAFGVHRVEAHAGTVSAEREAPSAFPATPTRDVTGVGDARPLVESGKITPETPVTPPLPHDAPQQPEAASPAGKPVAPSEDKDARVLVVTSDPHAGDAVAVLVRAAAAAGASAFAVFLAVLAHRHLSRRNVLGNRTREAVFETVKSRAGATITEVARAVNVRHTTATYHLDVLAEMGMVASERVGNRKHYFPAASHHDRGGRLAEVLPEMGRAKTVWDTLHAAGTARAADLAARCRMTPSGVLWHLKRLESLGLATSRPGSRGRVFEARGDAEPARDGA